MISGLIGIIIVELGWMLTELGRQPWAIYNKLLVADAFTQNINALKIGFIFPTLFLIMLIATTFALIKITKNWYKQEAII